MSDIGRLLQIVEDNADSQEAKTEAISVITGDTPVEVPKEFETEGDSANIEDNTPLYILIKNMKMAEKIKLAIFGNQSARSILIRDPLKLVSLFVLQNPRITDQEIVEFSRNKDLGEAVLRDIASNGTWMKNYQVKVNIVSNPRVPAPLAIKWLGHLLEKDLKKIGKSKDLPQVVSTQAKRLLSKKTT